MSCFIWITLHFKDVESSQKPTKWPAWGLSSISPAILEGWLMIMPTTFPQTRLSSTKIFFFNVKLHPDQFHIVNFLLQYFLKALTISLCLWLKNYTWQFIILFIYNSLCLIVNSVSHQGLRLPGSIQSYLFSKSFFPQKPCQRTIISPSLRHFLHFPPQLPFLISLFCKIPLMAILRH